MQGLVIGHLFIFQIIIICDFPDYPQEEVDPNATKHNAHVNGMYGKVIVT